MYSSSIPFHTNTCKFAVTNARQKQVIEPQTQVQITTQSDTLLRDDSSRGMDLITPPPSFEDRRRLNSTPPAQIRPDNTDSCNSSPSSKLARMRASYVASGYNVAGNLQLSAVSHHPLKSRESSPEHQFPRQSEQPIRTLSPVPTLIHTPRLGYGSSSPPPSTETYPDDVNTPPTTAMSSPPRSLWNGQRNLSEPSLAASPTTSNLSFEILSGYSSISAAEKVRKHQRDLMFQQHQRPGVWEREESPPADGHFEHQPVEFRPNSDLPFPISEGLRRYYPHAQTHEGFENRARRASAPLEFFERFNTIANTAKQRIGGGTLRGPPYRADQSPAEQEEQGEGMHPFSMHPEVSMAMSSGLVIGNSELVPSRVSSGIPSFTREFDMGWRGMFDILTFHRCGVKGGVNSGEQTPFVQKICIQPLLRLVGSLHRSRLSLR